MRVDPLDETAALVPGGRLGRYVLERVLGHGGMGVVWAAHDPDLDRTIAIKFLRTTDGGPDGRVRLLREARAMARLKHPSVLTVYEVGTEGGRDFIAMELVEGGTLAAWLRTPAPPRERVAAMLEAGRGLVAAHAAGLVHRDFKPHNVLRRLDGRVLVTDFGLARGHAGDVAEAPTLAPPLVDDAVVETTIDAVDDSVEPARAGRGGSLLHAPLTRAGMLVGTPAYMAPEQYTGAGPDPRTDQFAFCVACWEALAGERPYRGTTVNELWRAVRVGRRVGAERLPRAIRRVLERGLDPDPARRWPDLARLLDALERTQRAALVRRFAAAAFVAVAAIVAVTLALAHGSRATTSSATDACGPADAFDRAWSPSRRASVAAKVVNAKLGAALAVGQLDAARARWTDVYARVCAEPRAPKFHARLGCLLGERDFFASFGDALETMSAPVVAHLDMIGYLPRAETCLVDTPVGPPELPDDPARSRRIVALRTELWEAYAARPQLADLERKVADATAIGWPALIAEAQWGRGAAALRVHDLETARAAFRASAHAAEESNYAQLVAAAKMSLLLIEVQESEDPRHVDALREVREDTLAAIHAAGDDPFYVQRVAWVTGMVDTSQGDYDRANAELGEARRYYTGVEPTLAASVVEQEVLARLGRGRADDLDEADRALRAVREALASRGDRGGDAFQRAVARFATIRGDDDGAHDVLDALASRDPAAAPGGAVIAGRVVDEAGRPVAGARVIAWRGEIEGDVLRVDRDPADVAGSEIAVTGGDGRFALRTSLPRALVMAEAGARGSGAVRPFALRTSLERAVVTSEAGARRSRPVEVEHVGMNTADLVVPVAPTRTVRVTATTAVSASSLLAVARIDLGGGSWRELVGGGRDGAWTISGVPAGDVDVGVTNADGDATRTIVVPLAVPLAGDAAHVDWPRGATLDLIVRGADERRSNVAMAVIRDRAMPRTLGELHALERRARDVTTASAVPISPRTTTAAGRAVYERGDLHGRFADQPPGAVTACVAVLRKRGDADDDLPVHCRAVTVGAGDQAVLFDETPPAPAPPAQ